MNKETLYCCANNDLLSEIVQEMAENFKNMTFISLSHLRSFTKRIVYEWISILNYKLILIPYQSISIFNYELTIIPY